MLWLFTSSPETQVGIIFTCPIVLYETDHTVLASHGTESIPERDTDFTGDLPLGMKHSQYGRHRFKLPVFLMTTVGNTPATKHPIPGNKPVRDGLLPPYVYRTSHNAVHYRSPHSSHIVG